MFVEHCLDDLERREGIQWTRIVRGFEGDGVVRPNASQERDVERTGRRGKRLVTVHSTLVHCEDSRRSVVRMIGGAVVRGPSSEIGGVPVGDIGYIVNVAWVCVPFRVE